MKVPRETLRSRENGEPVGQGTWVVTRKSSTIQSRSEYGFVPATATTSCPLPLTTNMVLSGRLDVGSSYTAGPHTSSQVPIWGSSVVRWVSSNWVSAGSMVPTLPVKLSPRPASIERVKTVCSGVNTGGVMGISFSSVGIRSEFQLRKGHARENGLIRGRNPMSSRADMSAQRRLTCHNPGMKTGLRGKLLGLVLAFGTGVLGLSAGSASAVEAPDAGEVRWLAEHAVPVRSIAPEDEDFSDLMPLVGWIGSSRVVALGEVTHGDGAMFLAKARLVRFLHQVMGFDVLAWEAGFFDVPLVDAALRADVPLPEAAARGLYRIWWKSVETQPVFAYVRSTQATLHPILTRGLRLPGLQREVARRGLPGLDLRASSTGSIRR